jgi:hypothetical protein
MKFIAFLEDCEDEPRQNTRHISENFALRPQFGMIIPQVVTGCAPKLPILSARPEEPNC